MPYGTLRIAKPLCVILQNRPTLSKDKLNKEDKATELTKYRDLVLATIDYYLDNGLLKIKTTDFDSDEHYRTLKRQTEEHFKAGRLARLKQWFLDLTEMQVECGNLKFNKYLQDKTHYDIDIFKSCFQRVDKIVKKGKITSDNQYFDINIMVDQLCQTDPDSDRIKILNRLLIDYEQRKTRKANA